MTRDPFTAEQWCALLLTGTVCLAILGSLAAFAWLGPERMNQTGREGLIATITLIVGNVTGWMLRGTKP